MPRRLLALPETGDLFDIRKGGAIRLHIGIGENIQQWAMLGWLQHNFPPWKHKFRPLAQENWEGTFSSRLGTEIPSTGNHSSDRTFPNLSAISI